MTGIDDERGCLMILRAWLETDSRDALRVRIISTTPKGGEPRRSGSATVDDVCDQVRAWLEELVTGM